MSNPPRQTGSCSLSRRQKLALVLIHLANRQGRLPSTADLVHGGVHPNTVASLRRRECIEIHLPAVGTDGFRLTSAGKRVYAGIAFAEQVRLHARAITRPAARP